MRQFYYKVVFQVAGISKCDVHYKVQWYIPDFMSINSHEKMKVEKPFVLSFFSKLIVYII